MKFSQDFVERVLEANNIVDIISQLTPLRNSGRNFMGRCPFPDHKEKTPSFSVSEEKQVYHCFGCKKSGNIFNFLEQYHGMSFPEAVEHLANRAGIPIPKEVKEKGQFVDRDQKKTFHKINKEASDFFHQNLLSLPNEHVVWRYIKKRGLSMETIKQFQLGYAKDEWESLSQKLTQKHIPPTMAKDLGLIKARDNKSGYYDIFRHRLMFPIVSLLGEVVGFGGRVLDDSKPKYLNSPESPVFHKGKTFYGLNESAKYIRAEDFVIIVEGYMDYLALFQMGICNVVATLGTALTPDHGKVIKRLTRNVVVLFDGDSAGQTAAERSLPILLESGVVPKGLVLPDELDPDEYIIERGVEALKENIQNSKELFILILEKWMKNYKGDAGQKLALCDKLFPVFESVEDMRLLGLYLKEAAQKMRVEEAWLRQAMKEMADREGSRSSAAASATERSNTLKSKEEVALAKDSTKLVKSSNDEGPREEERFSVKGAHPAEVTILRLIMTRMDLLSKIQAEENFPNFLIHKGVQSLALKILDETRQSPDRFDKLPSLFVSRIDQPSEIIAPIEENEEDVVQLYFDCVKRLQSRYLQFQAQQIAKQIKVQGEKNVSVEKLEQIMNIQRNRHQQVKGKKSDDNP